ncbi:rhomboid-5 isoform X2 [Amblyomma americanum]
MECPPRGLRRGRLVLGGRPPTLDLIENPLFEGAQLPPVPAPRTLPPVRSQQRQPLQQTQKPQQQHQQQQPAAMHHTYPPPSQQPYGSHVSSAHSSVSSALAPHAVAATSAADDDDVEVRGRPKLSRSETIKRYVRKSTASFFGLDEESAPESCQRWTLRRKRLLSKRYGEIKEQYMRSKDWHLSHLQPLRADDTQDAAVRRSASARETTAGPFHRDPVYKMTWDGLTFLTTEVRKRLSGGAQLTRRGSRRSFMPSMEDVNIPEAVPMDGSLSQLPPPLDELVDDVFFDKTPSATPSVSAVAAAPVWPAPRTPMEPPSRSAVHPMTATAASLSGRRKDSTRWKRPASVHEDVTDGRLSVGMNRIGDKVLDWCLENSDRRQYGMGVIGKLLQRSFRRDRITRDVRQQLEDIEDHRPYFTYWVTTVQVLITIISLAVYGCGPIGFHKTQRTSLVMVTTLTLQQVDFYEPDNFWVGPRAADLVHLGAKFTPCMRKDRRIHDSIAKDRRKERNTACCVRNDRSGCVQTSRDKCSEVISTWRKWNVSQPGPPRWVADPSAVGQDRGMTQRRLSGSVCGQDPRYCEEPASVFPFEWPDDITKWPVCRRSHASRKVPDAHMSCEVVGRPCCIGVYGECHITTRDYCDFVGGFFHEEAALCSQVSCLNDVCGMIPFINPEVPDQFYRLWTSLFLHAGIFHLLITVIVQLFVMRDLEKLAGPVRTAVIYMCSGVAGNLASAIFVPYRAEVGPAGSQFGLLACLFVEVIHCWQMLKRPSAALLKLGVGAAVLFLLGLLPWVDNYAHVFGFVFGFLLSYALLPYVSFGSYDRTAKVALIWACLIVSVALFVGLVLLFYVHPIYECSFCHYLNCLPLTRDLCDSHRINITRQDT